MYQPMLYLAWAGPGATVRAWASTRNGNIRKLLRTGSRADRTRAGQRSFATL